MYIFWLHNKKINQKKPLTVDINTQIYILFLKNVSDKIKFMLTLLNKNE